MFNRFIQCSVSKVKEILSLQLHWGFVGSLQRDFLGRNLNTLTCGVSPHPQAQIWEALTLCVLWILDNSLLPL